MLYRKDGKFINFGIDVEIQKFIEKLFRGIGVGDVDLCKFKLKFIQVKNVICFVFIELVF